jgi:hypothetical protein
MLYSLRGDDVVKKNYFPNNIEAMTRRGVDIIEKLFDENLSNSKISSDDKKVLSDALKQFRLSFNILTLLLEPLRKNNEGLIKAAYHMVTRMQFSLIIGTSTIWAGNAQEILKKLSKREITKLGRAKHIMNTQLSREKLATALREVEKTIPLKSGLKYIEKNLRPNLPKHLPIGYRLPSDSTLKGIVSRMKRGQTLTELSPPGQDC